MKENSYYCIKWTAFFITTFILGIGIVITLLNSRLPQEEQKSEATSPVRISENGYYSNEDFSQLIEQQLRELNLFTNLSFQGTEEGFLSIRGTLKNGAALTDIFPTLSSFENLLKKADQEPFLLLGHLGEKEDGTGRLIVDTITFSNQKFSAGEATIYIEEYTKINDLFAVPIDEIKLNRNGITYQGALPKIIQTA